MLGIPHQPTTNADKYAYWYTYSSFGASIGADENLRGRIKLES